MVTFWRQPGDKTMKLQTKRGSKHISIERARFMIGLFKKNGYTITDYGHKIEVEKVEKK